MLTAFAEQVPKDGVVADVGCGPAQVACFLADLGVPVAGFDVSPGMVEAAQGRGQDRTCASARCSTFRWRTASSPASRRSTP
ncbi:class I SAM-dependent methyltransferase [Kitasatospora sp. NPDC048365]|uniref:class I SAM-dependent methyltransferase n=1 Tax=Kitasatospora sp. NPDC048365 TaxID=3364050 RepID=UPI00372392C3